MLSIEAVHQSHAERCREQGHVWENCCSIMFQVYQRCKWCGEVR
jgi:hypothetical protein